MKNYTKSIRAIALLICATAIPAVNANPTLGTDGSHKKAIIVGSVAAVATTAVVGAILYKKYCTQEAEQEIPAIGRPNPKDFKKADNPGKNMLRPVGQQQ